jgi:prolyl oligopeptidase
VQRILTATSSAKGWTIERGEAQPVGTAVGFSATDPAGDGVVLHRAGYLVPSRLELIGGARKAVPLYAEKPAFDVSDFVTELKTATSKDGTKIDYYLLRPKVIRPGSTPLLMTGYGAFGITLAPEYLGYSVGGKSLVPWLARGGAFALPMLRGGGERGAAWHQAAMREKRQNSYDDFAAVTEAIIKDGLTSPKHIGVFGSSNGGLLAAVMGTQRPDLYGAIVSDVPLTDLVRMPFMGMGAAWVNEYGDAKDPAMLAAINAYSPYQNIVAGKRYPPFLVTVATSDNRVGPGHARKLAARLKEVGAPVYYLEDQEGGHGVSDPLSRPELMADRMTFLFDTLR